MSKEIRESKVEEYLVEKVKAIGGEVRKLKWIGRNGAPDRLVMYKGAHFVEVKRPRKDLESHQEREHKRMAAHDLSVWTLTTPFQVDIFIEWLGKPKRIERSR